MDVVGEVRDSQVVAMVRSIPVSEYLRLGLSCFSMSRILIYLQVFSWLASVSSPEGDWKPNAKDPDLTPYAFLMSDIDGTTMWPPEIAV